MYPANYLNYPVPNLFFPQQTPQNFSRSFAFDQLAGPFEAEETVYTIFIGCLHGKTTEEIVEKYFAHTGPIYDVVLKKKGQAGSAGFGTFKVRSYNQFIQITGQEHFLLGRKIICRQYFQGKEKEEFLKDLNQRRIYLRNIPLDISDLDLRSIFSRLGRVNKAYAIRDEFGNSKGFGYVCFEEKHRADFALSLKSIQVLPNQFIDCLPYCKDPAQAGKYQVPYENPQKAPLRHSNPINFVPPPLLGNLMGSLQKIESSQDSAAQDYKRAAWATKNMLLIDTRYQVNHPSLVTKLPVQDPSPSIEFTL